MQVAQSLYENGHITYMRTDSTNLAAVAIDDARGLVERNYGREYVPDEPRVYKSKVKNAQEAHEAIRPAGHPFELPEAMRSQLGVDEFRLFDMIWKRTIASQMADARGRRISITIEGEGCLRAANHRLPRLLESLRRRIGRPQRRAGRPGEHPAERDRRRTPLLHRSECQGT
jgi:DNA topoisomerase-1